MRALHWVGSVVALVTVAATGLPVMAEDCRSFNLAVHAVADPKYSQKSAIPIKGSEIKDFSTCTGEAGVGSNTVICATDKDLSTSNILARLQQCVGFDHSLLVVRPQAAGGARYSSLLLDDGIVATIDQYFSDTDMRQAHTLVIFKPDQAYHRIVKDGYAHDLERTGLVVDPH